MPRWDAWLAGLAEVLGPLLLDRAAEPRLAQAQRPERDPPAGLAPPRPGRPHDRRRDPADDDDRSPTCSTTGSSRRRSRARSRSTASIGTWAGPYEPGTAYVMAHHSIGDVGDGHLGNWGFRRAAWARSPTRSPAPPAQVRRRDPDQRAGSARLLLNDGRASGVELENGRADHAPRSSSRALHPRTAFLDHVGRANLPDDFVTDIEHWKTRSGVVKINLALAELPDFTADPGTNLQEHHTGSVEMAPTMPYIERAFTEAREGRPAVRPFSDGVIPTAFDKTLVPEGVPHHVAVHPVGAVGLERRAAHRGARGLRRPDDRLLQRGRAELQELDHPHATSWARTRWSTSTA